MRQARFERFDSCDQLPLAILRFAKAGLVGLALLFGGATQAQTLASLPTASRSIEKGGTARPVVAWSKFCQRYPGECAIDPAEPALIQLTPETWRTLVSVNRRVNTRIKPLTDKEHWGVVDQWDFPDDGYGDCEDYQILKRRMLVDDGLPRRALRMTVVIDELGEGHAVLMARTDRGDFVLDNKTNAVLPWAQTGYTFVKREGQDSMAWVSLNGVASPVSTANR
jgi:predicted transglutaminase-like cysteine proteinase